MFCAVLFSVNSAQASVSVDLGSFGGVDYNNGQPTPTNVTATFNIVNDESAPLTISNLTIDSVSMGFYDLPTGNDWSCGYVETHTAPNFERTTTCIPNSSLILDPGDSTSVSLIFFSEDTSGTSITHPDAVGLTDVALNGNTVNSVEADLGKFGWNIIAEDEHESDDADDDVDDSNSKTGKVRGYVYFDDNDNSKRDDNEEGVEGIKIKLHYAGSDDKFDTGDDERYTDKTNKEGKYRFGNLAPGAYRLKIKDGQMVEFYLTSEKDEINGKSHFSLKGDETKERDFGYDRDRDQHGNSKNDNLHYLQSGFHFTIQNVILYLKDIFL
jgi:hypothetical protein